ncbi:odorant receptor Or1-like [Diabrotica virgifera virgifera]|uniref:Odorant receptor n=1 Tax=Diabrotica virgifera virgifera TaxID=50390 RepID=A0ABM5JML3_DIAVI|nr:odorant receptor Or1-like [Diabrotica virgifera virgifera]
MKGIKEHRNKHRRVNLAVKNPEFKFNFKDIVKYNVTALYVFAFMVPNITGFMSGFLFGLRFLLFVVCVYICQIATEAINLFRIEGSVSDIASASFLFLTHMVQVVKVYYLYKYIGRIKILINLINCKEFQPKSNFQRETLKSYIKMARFITLSFWGACVCTCSFWAIYPFTLNELQLPLAGWFPFDTTKTPYFEWAYTFQIISTALNGISNISIDTLMSSLIMVICAQLNILNDSLRNIRPFAEAELDQKGFRNATDRDEISPRLQYTMNRILVECIVHHRCILKFSTEFQALFANSILGQFIVSGIIICVTLFEMAMTPAGSIQFFSLLLYQMCMLLEVFLCCYYGNEIIIKSNSLTVSAYHCDWVYSSEQFKKNLIFLMTRSQLKTIIYVGNFIPLSLDSFVKILKSSWSYFALLMSLNK